MPREHPEADLQKASPTVWEGRGSRVRLGPFDLSSYIEPGCGSGKRQAAGGYVGHGHPRVFTPASSAWNTFLPWGRSPQLPLVLCSDAWLRLSQSEGLCFALGFVPRGIYTYRASSLVLSREEKGSRVDALSPNDGNSRSMESNQEAMMCFEDDGRRIRTACSRR